MLPLAHESRVMLRSAGNQAYVLPLFAPLQLRAQYGHSLMDQRR